MFHRLAVKCMQRCDQLSLHTETPGVITRRFLTPPMKRVHQDIGDWMRQAGMNVRVDAGGNLIGNLSRSGDPNAKRLVIGSHLDTIPNGGRYDGILGVMIGIAVVQSLGDQTLPFDLEVVGFSEEEGVRFSMPYFGSHTVAGTFDPGWLELTDGENLSLASVIESFGLSPRDIPASAMDPANVIGFIEAHIEQGPVLARDNLAVAAVGAIAGQTRMTVAFHGRAGHAGTTPMDGRADPLVAAARWIASVSDYANSVDDLRATIGRASVMPGARNVIPGGVELSLDVRHGIDSVRQRAVDDLIATAIGAARAGGVTFEIVESQLQDAALMDARLTDAMVAAITRSGHRATTMLSGAGHDAAVMAARFPTAMLFIRQPHGISHHPDEDVETSDVAVAIEVLANLVRHIA